MSDQPTLRKPTGSHAHKNPECPCNSCTARRRTQAALSSGTGAGREAFDALPPKERMREVMHADLPVLKASGFTSRDRVGQWLEMRLADPTIQIREAAAKMGVGPRTLSRDIQIAVREKWLVFSDALERVEFEIIPKVVNNISELLDNKDRLTTIETAKQTIFKDYQVAHGSSDHPTTVLALKIENVPSDNTKVLTGVVVGVPTLLEGEVKGG